MQVIMAPMNAYARLFSSLIQQARSERPCAVCMVVSSRGSTPQTAGAMLLLHADGRIEGTLGGGCVEAEVRRRALEMLHASQSGVLTFHLNHDYGWDDGLICGGRMDVAVMPVLPTNALECFQTALFEIERQNSVNVPIRVEHEGQTLEYRLHVEPTPTLLIAGAGHVGAAVARLGVMLDFRVIVVDDRPDLMGSDRLASPIEAVIGDIAATLKGWPVDANTYVVVVTRGHQHDEQALHAVIDSPARYLGLIGSRRKIKLIFDDLAELGVDRAKLDRVHSPIGLDINAVTVAEIAVSIAAELIQVRREQKGKPVEGPFEVQSGM
jgi:xanthine dehydrogenase accessory factor